MFVLALILRSATVRRKIFSEWNLLKNKALAFSPPKNRGKKNTLYILALVLCVIAMSGLQWGQKEQSLKTEGLDICLAIDISKSMLAEDASPNRLGQIKNQMTAFLPRLSGDRVTLVAFAGSAYIASPLTSDYVALINYLSPLEPSFISNQATSFDTALKTCLRALKIDEIKEQEELEWEASKLIVLVSDGEETISTESPSLQKLKELNVPVYAIASGTPGGAKIPIRDESNRLKGYIKDRAAGTDATTKLQDESLKKIASETGGNVYYASQGLGAWSKFFEDTKNFKRSSQDAGTKLSKEQRFQIPLLIAIIFLLLDFLMTETKFPWTKYWRKKNK